MVVKIPHKRTDKICNLYKQGAYTRCYCVLGINWLQIKDIMTEEQIKQNADIYADKLYKDGRCIESTAPTIQEIYIAGAYSRDEEIEHYRRIATAYKIDAQDTAAECERLHDIIDKLHNPWISVEDRLPEKINTFMSEPVLCRYTRGNKEYYHVCQYDYEFDEWQISKVTHWMPIPELPKGGEK